MEPIDYATPSPSRKWNIPALILNMLVVFGLMSFIVFFLLPSRNGSFSAPTVQCAANLKSIGQCIFLYANDNNGNFPDSFKSLFLAEDLTGSVLICPESSDTAATGPTTQSIAQNLSVAGHLSYVYSGSGLTSSTAYDHVVAYEPPSHHGGGINVLFGDGHVDFIRQSEAKKLITELQSGHNPPRSEMMK